MSEPAKILRALVATPLLGSLAGCAQQAWQPPPAAAASSPELTGVWYQVYFDTNSTAINDRGKMIVKNVAYVATNKQRDARDGDRQD